MNRISLVQELAAIDLAIAVGESCEREAHVEGTHSPDYWRGWNAAFRAHREFILGSGNVAMGNVVMSFSEALAKRARASHD
jgi:hypothetical protein